MIELRLLDSTGFYLNGSQSDGIRSPDRQADLPDDRSCVPRATDHVTRSTRVETETSNRAEMPDHRADNFVLGDAECAEAVVPQSAVDDMLRVRHNDENFVRLWREWSGQKPF